MNRAHEHRLQAITTAFRVVTHSNGDQSVRSAQEPPAERFVTISRQSGAGGKGLGEELANAVNRLTPDAEPWCSWDNELVTKIARDHGIPSKFLEAIEDADHDWLSEFVASISSADDPSESKIYRRVAMTVRALATAGRAVIVGRGGAFITEGLPGGIHVRLVAPIESRIRQMAERLHVSLDDASVRVRDIDCNRAAFYYRYWPTKNLTPETFTLTFNTAELTEPQMVACLLPLVLGDQAGVLQSSSHLRREEPLGAA